MITFSDFDLQPITEGQAWAVDMLLYAAILAVAGALAAGWLLYAAQAWSRGLTFKAVYRVLMIPMAWAITVGAEQVGAPGGSVVLQKITKVTDGLPMGSIQKRDAKLGTGFFDPAKQFPLNQRLRDDFSGDLPSSAAPLVREFATECMTEAVDKTLTDATYADAVALVGGRKVPYSNPPKNCKDFNHDIGVTLAASKGTRSNFSIRRAEARVSAGAAATELSAAAAPGERLQRLLAREIPVKDGIGLEEAGTLHGEVAEGFIKAYVYAPVFVLLPGGLWNLGIYTLGFLTARTVTGYSAFKLHQKELACIQRLDVLDAQDTSLEPLHARELHYVKGGVDRKYVEVVEGCVRSKRTTQVLEWMGLGLTGALMLAGWWIANR